MPLSLREGALLFCILGVVASHVKFRAHRALSTTRSATLEGVVNNFAGLAALRVLLGAFGTYACQLLYDFHKSLVMT